MKKENEDKCKGNKDNLDEDRTNLIDDSFLVKEHDVVNVVDSASSWMIKNGTFVHVTFKRDISRSYTTGEFGDVKRQALNLEVQSWNPTLNRNTIHL